MIHRFFLLLSACGYGAGLPAQIQFVKQNGWLTPANHYSGVAIAVLDMNGDGRDDIVRMDQGFDLAIEYQSGAGQPFQRQAVATLTQGSQWAICAGDLDNNGFPDLLSAGYKDGVKVLRAAGSTFNLTLLNAPEIFAQCANLADIDNDGRLDAFVCSENGPPLVFMNNGAGNLIHQPAQIDLKTFPPSDGSGNYGSVWSDIDNDGDTDLYIAKCKDGVNDPADGRRVNQLFRNNGDGTYSQDSTNVSGLRIGAQSWTADFGDIDNDGDFDCFITNHDVPSQLLENDGAGHFTDITLSSGLFNAVTGLAVQGVFRDFDNDGFVDMLVAGSEHHLFRNNGDKTFTTIPILDDAQMESFALGDLNSDGFQDIYAGYAEVFNDPSIIPDALWINGGNGNSYFGLNLRGVQSNRSGVGAKVLLYSALGVQVREVRSGESYGIMNSTQVHFGMGQISQIDSVIVHWPSGLSDRLYKPALNQYFDLEEGSAGVPVNEPLRVENPVLLFPNPASEEIFLDWEHFPGGTLRMTLRDNLGIGQRTVHAECPPGTLRIPVRLDGLPVGIYRIELIGPERMICKQIVKQ